MSKRPPYRRAAPPQPSSPPPPGEQTLKGALTRFTFRNDENAYAIARFLPEETGGGARRKEEIVVTGTLVSVEQGETLELTGQWTQNPKYGV